MPKPSRWPQGLQTHEAEAVRQRCEDVQVFAETFLGHLCRDPWSPMHQDFFAEYRAHAGQRGRRDSRAAPRNHAKTTVRFLVKSLHEMCYATERFIVVFASRTKMAVGKVKMARQEFDTNVALRQIYGITPGETWNNGDFITSNRCRMVATSRRTQERGLLWDGIRPTKIYLEDAEHSEEVLTLGQREKFEKYITEDILKLGEEGLTNIDAIGTILCEGSWLDGTMTNPGWHARKYQAVRSFATNVPLWQQWRRLVLDLTNPQRLEDAQAFYEAHEVSMLEGAEVLWPEHVSYVQLMLGRLVDGEAAFWQEMQNEPYRDARSLFDLDNAAYCTVEPQGLRRYDGRWVAWQECSAPVAYFDPTAGTAPTTHHDWASCCILVQDQYGYKYCIDAYHQQLDKTSTQISSIMALLARWEAQTFAIEANGFQSRLVEDFQEAYAAWQLATGQAWDLRIVPATNTRNKVLRIQTLEPDVTNGWLVFADSLPPSAMDQLRRFVPRAGATPDDFPDALEGGMRVLAGRL